MLHIKLVKFHEHQFLVLGFEKKKYFIRYNMDKYNELLKKYREIYIGKIYLTPMNISKIKNI